jgi:hypothetical protein
MCFGDLLKPIGPLTERWRGLRTLALSCPLMAGCTSFPAPLDTLGPVIIRAVPKNRVFETRFRIRYRVCEYVAVILAACVNMSKCCRSHAIEHWIYLELS